MVRQGKVGLLCALAWGTVAEASDRISHGLRVDLDPGTHVVRVTDTIAFPEGPRSQSVDFVLNSALTISESDPPLQKIPLGAPLSFFGPASAGPRLAADELSRYRAELSAAGRSLTLSYEGTIHDPLSDPKEEYTRGFRETAGLIAPEGIYLAGSTVWYPRFGDDLVEFDLEVTLPAGWHVISQGSGTSRDAAGRARWRSDGPMEEIFLVGGPLVVEHEAAGAVHALVYLHERDEALAQKYLGATAQYLEMYRHLIGPYPYTKFALVENFWETGYGMPSFTLLGPTVLRFPFILHSSYPHEILHNWWGNSVLVDYSTGNWCEGLTAYLADHLIKEQRGQGEEFRRDTLQKYRDYVNATRDFPLSEFRSRHSAATEAVGYGKTLMGFHMLRRHLGDEAFRRGLVRLYRAFKGKRASFADLRASLEGEANEDLAWFFNQWVERTGAAALEVSAGPVSRADGGYAVDVSLAQVQSGEPFTLEVPVAVSTTSGVERRVVRLEEAVKRFTVRSAERPLLLQVDPQFDLFRRLDPRETPPSLGQIFGEAEILAVLPAAAGQPERANYRQLLEAWQSDSHKIEVRFDSELAESPPHRSLWLLGKENRWAERLFVSDPELAIAIDPGEISIGGERVPFPDHSTVLIRRHPENLEKAVGWLVVHAQAAFAGMARKLPHYGKYSYLAFQGDEPTNIVKGVWPTADSPLLVDLRPEGERAEPVAMPPEPRAALADLPPVFSQQRLGEHVAFLASPEREGRGVGSVGLRQAAAYIDEQFRCAGHLPGGDDGSYLQELTVEGPGGEAQTVANLIGYLPGTESTWREQSVVVCAHYDHLGRGWPDVHRGDEGTIHPGADDNASGVAVLLELARNVAAGERPRRNLTFVAFTAEEAGRLGSRYFVENPTPFPLEKILGVINLDTVGRLHDQPLSVLGTGTATEWQHIFRGVSYTTGIASRNVAAPLGASDESSFIDNGIPAVQIFTRAHADYHRPTDTADRVDAAGLVSVATFVKEAVAYLTQREAPLTVTIAGASGSRARPTSSGRRVLFGTVPDFAFTRPGVRIESTVAGSPAEEAGLQAGDVLLAIDGKEIGTLQHFSAILRSLSPGQTVAVAVRRAGETLTVSVTVAER